MFYTQSYILNKMKITQLINLNVNYIALKILLQMRFNEEYLNQ